MNSTRVYGTFHGCDFTSSADNCAKDRFYICENIEPSVNGNYRKRTGYRKMLNIGALCTDSSDRTVYGIFGYQTQNGEHFIVHCGKSLFDYNPVSGSAAKISQNMNQKKSKCVMLTDKMYIFDGNTITLVYTESGEIAAKALIDNSGTVSECDMYSTYIPLTVIGRLPDGSGGTSYEAVNLLSPYMTVQFYAAPQSVNGIPTPAINTQSVLLPTPVGKELTVLQNGDLASDYLPRVEYLAKASDGSTEWKPVPGYTFPTYTLQEYNSEGTNQYVNRQKIMLCYSQEANGYGLPTDLSDIVGEDNIRVTYKFSQKTIDSAHDISLSENAKKILKGNVIGTFGVGGNNRVTVAMGNTDFLSGLNDASYFPDNAYSIIGNSSSSIAGYLNIGSNQAIIKDRESQTDTTWLRSASLDSDGETVLSAFCSGGRLGAVNSDCVSYIGNVPVMLTDCGVVSVEQGDYEGKLCLKCRSYFINSPLLCENLSEAFMVRQKNRLFICFPETAEKPYRQYILDGRNGVTAPREGITAGFEGYYFENLPICSGMESEGRLWFGTHDGFLCRMCSETDTENEAYTDGFTLTDGAVTGGSAIHAKAAVVCDDDSIPGYYKNLCRRGTYLTLVPLKRQSVTVSIKKDAGSYEKVEVKRASYLDFDDFSFVCACFSTNRDFIDVMIKKNVRKYKRLSFLLENNVSGEGMQIARIVKSFRPCGQIKR